MDPNYHKAMKIISKDDKIQSSTNEYPDVPTFDEWLEEVVTLS